MLSPWRSHPVTSYLFLRHSFTPQGYTLQLTDLAHLWSETLTRQAILDRAAAESTSIDPADDARQFAFLLKKLCAAVDGEEGTSLFWSAQRAEVSVSCELPGGLAPLEWTFRLQRQSGDAFKESVVLPLLGLADVQRQREADLVSVIREKDAVLTRILDKLDATGVDLGSVFPTAGVGRRGKRDQVEAYRRAVRGLGRFDVEAWESRDGEGFEGQSNKAGEDVEESMRLLSSTAVRECVEKLNKALADGSESMKAQQAKVVPSLVKNETQKSGVSVDEFETQEVPAATRSGASDADHTKTLSTELDAHDDPPSAHLPAQGMTTANGTNKPEKRKLGLIGGRRAKVSSSPQPSSATESEHGNGTPPPDPVPINAKPSPRGKLGKLGGKKPASESPDPAGSMTQLEKRTEDEIEGGKPRRGKLGRIGGQARNKTADQQDDSKTNSSLESDIKSESQQISAIASSASQPFNQAKDEIEEDPTERANKKREELKRQVEEQSKNQAKRKRRF